MVETGIDTSRIYIGDKPIAIAKSTTIEADEPDLRPWPKEDREEFSRTHSASFNVPCGGEDFIRAWQHIFVADDIMWYWQCNHRGCVLHYIAYWDIVNKHLARMMGEDDRRDWLFGKRGEA